MINKKQFLSLCEDNNLLAFEVQTMLDEDTDILLESDDIDEFFKVCACYDVKCIFYVYIEQKKEMYIIEELSLLQHVTNVVNNEIEKNSYRDFTIDGDVLIQKYQDKVIQIANEQNNKLNSYKWGTPLYLDAYISCNGDRIGMSMYHADETPADNLKRNTDVLEEIAEEICNEIAELYENEREYQQSLFEKEEAEQEARYEEAIKAIEDLLQTSTKLMECTNQKLRHAYARELADEFADKYDTYITIGEVDVLVEQEYKRRKNNK